MIFQHREIIDTIPSYKQGKPAPVVEGQRSYKISSNENPFEPLPGVIQTVADQALHRINRYPDMWGWKVLERIAQENGVEPENIILGCGSTEVITQLVSLVSGPCDEVIYPWRGFEAYPIIVAGAGATSVPVENLADGSHNIDGMIAALNEHTRLVIVNNPNNPTSASLSDEDARRLVDAVPSDVLILFDEAYFQFNTNPDANSAIELFRDHPNVVVAQTFSKAYGLAGLRIGFAIAQQPVVEAMRKVAVPFGVTEIAQTAALASMDAYEALEERVKAIIAERTRVVKALKEQGWEFPEPYANFFWLALGERTDEAAQEFMKAGLSVRVFSGEGIRISIGEVEANDTVIQVCAKLKSMEI